jgi:hypothetical protein
MKNKRSEIEKTSCSDVMHVEGNLHELLRYVHVKERGEGRGEGRNETKRELIKKPRVTLSYDDSLKLRGRFPRKARDPPQRTVSMARSIKKFCTGIMFRNKVFHFRPLFPLVMSVLNSFQL